MAQTLIQDASPKGATQAPTQLRQTWLVVGLFLLGVGAAVVALLGPLVGEVIRYHASKGAVNQIIGGDVAGLVLVAPVSILAAILVWRGHLAGPVLALGPAVYALYTYSQLALGGDFARYRGNTERFFPLFLGLFVVAGAIAIRSWRIIDPVRLPATRRWVDRTVGIFFLVVAFFLAFGLHLPGLIDAWSAEPTSTEYLADPVVFWLVKFMDLGLVVPALVVVGFGILRGRPWANKLRYPAIGWAALLGSSVAGMAIVMQATADPAGSTANTVAFSTFAAIAIAVATVVYWPLFRASSAAAEPVTERSRSQ
ncbi:MAG TPA: hypothetical protein VE569_13005 [Acidimicrobiia bacterium]|nr:hypothetical protein [Acidimicrobiia bacterium]